jgi:hypothetical protein
MKPNMIHQQGEKMKKKNKTKISEVSIIVMLLQYMKPFSWFRHVDSWWLRGSSVSGLVRSGHYLHVQKVLSYCVSLQHSVTC